MTRILVFDNYDSFTYNLVHLVEKILHLKVEVFRNDQIPLERVKDYDKIVLSPGPGLPEDAGLLLPLIREYAPDKCILGVCLGHQAIGEAFGGKLINLSTVYHGVATPVRVVNRVSSGGNRQSAIGNRQSAIVSARFNESANQEQSEAAGDNSRLTIDDSRIDLFRNLPDEFEAGRYHSWIISDDDFPEDLEITARDDNNYIMALRHRTYDVQGVQFHPESVLTPLGEKIMRNWLGA